MEEPPMKVTKFEMETQYLEGEVMEDGQEEWLSEGILTDDDYNPASQETQPDQNESNVGTSQDSSMTSVEAETEAPQQPETIEETLNSLENHQISQSLPDELDAFLIRKTDGKVVELQREKESDIDESVKQSDDDGNDTDDLLRVLGDGDQKKKEGAKKIQDGGESSDDDEFIFQGAKIKSLEVAKNALMRAPASKATPEDDDVTDCSSDEASTVKKIFGVQEKKSDDVPKLTTTITKTVSNTTNSKANSQRNSQTNSQMKSQTKIQTKSQMNSETKTQIYSQTKIQMSSQTKSQMNSQRNSQMNSQRNSQTKSQTISQKKPVAKKHINVVQKSTPVPVAKLPTPHQFQKKLAFPQPLPKKTEPKPSEEITNEHQLKNNDIHLDEELTQRETQVKKPGQRLMKPEVMDEEVLTDPETDSEEESLYDELPSSDSENMEDWFTLDIRAERAGDYLPLLGDKAYQLLLDEKRRVSARLETLKNSLNSLTQSGKEQADKLREATSAAAELDAMLRAG